MVVDETLDFSDDVVQLRSLADVDWCIDDDALLNIANKKSAVVPRNYQQGGAQGLIQ